MPKSMSKDDATLRKDFLKEPVGHIDITSFDSTPIIEQMGYMSFTARETAKAAKLFDEMLRDDLCTIFLCIAGSTIAAGCKKVYADIVRYNMADVVVATGASIVDMDFFEALGFKHYVGTPDVNDNTLKECRIDRIYDTYIDEEQLKFCDMTITKIAESMVPGSYSSREFITKMGKFLKKENEKSSLESLVRVAYENNVPIFSPAFSDSSAGFGLVFHQRDRLKKKKEYVAIDSVQDFRELTQIKKKAKDTGLFIVGGGVPKNFAQDTVVCAEVLGYDAPMHKYAVQLTVADVRDGACSSSTLREAHSWGKVNLGKEQMVYAEATLSLPLIVSYVYHQRNWENRKRKEWNGIFGKIS